MMLQRLEEAVLPNRVNNQTCIMLEVEKNKTLRWHVEHVKLIEQFTRQQLIRQYLNQEQAIRQVELDEQGSSGKLPYEGTHSLGANDDQVLMAIRYSTIYDDTNEKNKKTMSTCLWKAPIPREPSTTKSALCCCACCTIAFAMLSAPLAARSI